MSILYQIPLKSSTPPPKFWHKTVRPFTATLIKSPIPLSNSNSKLPHSKLLTPSLLKIPFAVLSRNSFLLSLHNFYTFYTIYTVKNFPCHSVYSVVTHPWNHLRERWRALRVRLRRIFPPKQSFFGAFHHFRTRLVYVSFNNALQFSSFS